MASKLGKSNIEVKRVYEKTSADDGARFLVDGLLPRGVSKSKLKGVEWVKDVAPSAALRKWYGHDPGKWTEFRKRYRAELVKNRDAWKPLLAAAKESHVMLLTATHDVEISHAMVLGDFLKRKTSA